MPPSLTPPRIETVVCLPDGRRIGVAEYGPARGRPVVWLHGTPGGRHQIPEPLRAALGELDVRLIVVERPGYGSSTPHRYRDMRGIVEDVGYLLDGLGIDRFGVAALSGGGPYALAIGHGHGERVVAAAILGGVVPHAGPDAHPGGLVALAAPFSGVLRMVSAPMGAALGWAVQVLDPLGDPVFRAATRIFPPGDRAVFELPHMQAMFMHDIVHTARGGLSGPMLDLSLFTRYWGFRLADVGVPVHFWQGDADPIVTLEGAQQMADAVPTSTFRLRPGESHLGGFAVATEAIEAILGDWRG